MPSGSESVVNEAPTAPPGERPPAVEGLLWLVWRLRWPLFAGVALFYLAAFNGQWRVEPDSALYLTLATNLAEGRGYVYHGQPHNLAFPGLPWLVAGTFRVFGVGVLWPAHVLMLVFAAAGLLLTFRLFSLYSTARVAVLMTWALACTHFYFRYAFQLRNDLPFLVGVLACLAGYEAIFGRRANGPIQADSGAAADSGADPGGVQPPSGRWYDWLLLAVGLGLVAVMRPTMWLFLPVLLVAVLWALRRALRWGHLAGAALVAGVLAGFWLLDPRREGGMVLGGYEEIALQTLPNSLGRVWENLLRLIDAAIPEVLLGIELEWTILNALAAVVIAGLGLALVRVRLLWGLWVAATLGVMLLMEPVARYLVSVLPLLVYGWWRGLEWLGRRPSLPGRDWIFIALAMLWIGPNVGKNIGLILEQRQRPFLAHYREGRFEPVMEMSAEVRRQVAEGEFVIAPRGTGRIYAYFSDRWVVDPGELAGWQGPHEGLYIIQPLEPEQASAEPLVVQFLEELVRRAGPPLARVERGDDLPPLTLHHVPAAAMP